MTPARAPLLSPSVPETFRLQSLDLFAGSLANKVFLSLKSAILSLDYQPGEILRKPEICAELGVSRSPVSEAIARLNAEGLVDVVPQAGTFVARFSMAEIREGAFLREALELAAAALVAKSIRSDQLALLQDNLQSQAETAKAHDFDGFYRLDAEMHDLILSFTGYRRLSQISQSAWVHVNRARRLLLPTPGRLLSVLAEHRAIVAALAAHDQAGARRATRDHLRQLVTLLEPLVVSRPELFDPA